MEEFAFLFCESCFVVEQVNNLSLSCGLFRDVQGGTVSPSSTAEVTGLATQ
ncbi:TPA: colicin release lysis protein [Escherichia coli]|nr:colicin release lysis protein [Escherichia coli]